MALEVLRERLKIANKHSVLLRVTIFPDASVIVEKIKTPGGPQVFKRVQDLLKNVVALLGFTYGFDYPQLSKIC